MLVLEFMNNVTKFQENLFRCSRVITLLFFNDPTDKNAFGQFGWFSYIGSQMYHTFCLALVLHPSFVFAFGKRSDVNSALSAQYASLNAWCKCGLECHITFKLYSSRFCVEYAVYFVNWVTTFSHSIRLKIPYSKFSTIVSSNLGMYLGIMTFSHVMIESSTLETFDYGATIFYSSWNFQP